MTRVVLEALLLAAVTATTALWLRERRRALRAERTDPLTGLLNARAFRERLSQEAARAERTGCPLSVSFLDVDEFKAFNDRHGHACGDELLTTVGEVLRTRLRSYDAAARVGGDEFAWLLPEAGAAEAAVVAERIRAALEEAAEGLGTPVRFSIGTADRESASRESEGLAAEGLLAEADRAMYRDKSRAGRAAEAGGVRR